MKPKSLIRHARISVPYLKAMLQTLMLRIKLTKVRKPKYSKNQENMGKNWQSSAKLRYHKNISTKLVNIGLAKKFAIKSGCLQHCFKAWTRQFHQNWMVLLDVPKRLR